MFKIIKENKNPILAIITPLRKDDKISRNTKVSLKRNDVPFIWGSYSGEGNVVQNFKHGMACLEEYRSLPKYVIKIDNDTKWTRNTLDCMVESLNNSNSNEAYTYCNFKYTGAIKAYFPAISFDGSRLKRANYISSNSMFKTSILNEIEMPHDNKYKRLLDWVYFLKLLRFGYIGKPSKGYFVAKADETSISAGSVDDYKLKHQRVKEDFIDPFY